MLKKCSFAAALLLVGSGMALADTLELRDQASIQGKILSEKRDQVAIDVGYTVLVIPKNQIKRVVRSGQPRQEEAPSTAVAPVVPSPAVAVAPASVGSSSQSSQIFRESARAGEVRNVRDLVNILGESVVQIRTPGGLGSGFFINEDGYLITNFHVIEGETQISVEVYHLKDGQLDRKSYKQVRIVAMNKFEDLALLKVEDNDAPKFKYVDIGNADSLAVGERVFAIGSPLGLERTVTEGILSTKTRQMQGELYLQTTAQINPGNSGGPLFNMAGEVVGVTNMKISFGEGLGFAIPAEAVKYFLRHRDAYAYSNENPSNPYRYLEPPSRTRQPVVE